MNDQQPVTNETLVKFLNALGDALFDFSIGVGRAVDIIRPDLSSEVSRDISPCSNHNIDAGGNCYACGYNSDVARAEPDYDYGDVPLTVADHPNVTCARHGCLICGGPR